MKPSRFRFRAWDKTYKNMINDYCMGRLHGDWFIDRTDPVTHDTVETCDNVDEIVIMQSTGLADKNGTEIFEGDLLKDGVGQVNEIKYDAGQYWFNWLQICDAVEPWEVIGNVYEADAGRGGAE